MKRIAGERVEVWADIYRDGHDVVSAAVVWRASTTANGVCAPMSHHSNDRWGGSFVPDYLGRYVYAIEAWTDEFASWHHEFELKLKAGADLTLDAIEGAGMLTKAQAGGGPAGCRHPAAMRGLSSDRRHHAAVDRRTEDRDGRKPVPARP